MLLRDNVPHVNLTSSLQARKVALLLKSEEDPEAITPDLHAFLFEAFSTRWKPALGGTEYDPTKVFLALCMTTSKSFLQSDSVVAKHVAHLKYCIRLVALKEIHERVAKNRAEDTLEALMQIKNVIQEMTRCTFASICSVQHLASAFVMSRNAVPKVQWKDTSGHRQMTVHGTDVSLQDITNALTAAQDEMESCPFSFFFPTERHTRQRSTLIR
jgi:hypothetical protein